MKLSFDRRQFLGLAGAAGAAAIVPFGVSKALAASPLAFQASWINDAEFAGYFVAADKGYYKDEGLNLSYLSGGPDVIPESTLLTARADVTLTTPDTTIKAISEQGAPFRIIGAQFQKNPLGVVSLKKSGINEPKDLIGKTLAVPPVNVISVQAMLAANNIKADQVNIVPYAYDPTPLIKGEIDASVDFVTNVPYTIKLAGEEASSFLLYDFGYTVFNDTVVVSEDTLKTRRKELVSFLRASRKGWDENFVDPAKYPSLWAKTWFKGTGRAIDNEIYYNTAQKPLIEAQGGVYSMSEEAIAATIEALSKVGIAAKREHFDTTLLEEI